MFIIDKYGELREGESLSEEIVEIRKELVELMHERVCRNGFHSAYDRRTNGIPECEKISNFLITKFTLQAKPGVGLGIAIEEEKEYLLTVASDPPSSPPQIPTEQVDDVTF